MSGFTTKFLGRKRALGPVQVCILKIVDALNGKAFGTSITSELSKHLGRELADGQVYVALRRLETSGLIVAAQSDQPSKPSKRSRGRPRKFYQISASGKRALESADAIFNFERADLRNDRGHDDGRQNKGKGLTPVVG